MPLSKIRQIGGAHHNSEPLASEEDLKVFEVFTRKSRGHPHVHAGALHAPDLETAVQLAREHYGQDEACVHIWVVDRAHLGGTDPMQGPINKAIEHSYRYVRDYQGVRALWQRFRDETGLQEYEKEDLKEGY